MEKLKNFFNQLSQEKRKEFCLEIGVSQGFLRKKISTKSLFNPKTCSKIEQVTNGEVTRQDLRQDLRPDWREIWIELAEKETANQDDKK